MRGSLWSPGSSLGERYFGEAAAASPTADPTAPVQQAPGTYLIHSECTPNSSMSSREEDSSLQANAEPAMAIGSSSEAPSVQRTTSSAETPGSPAVSPIAAAHAASSAPRIQAGRSWQAISRFCPITLLAARLAEHMSILASGDFASSKRCFAALTCECHHMQASSTCDTHFPLTFLVCIRHTIAAIGGCWGGRPDAGLQPPTGV